MYTGGRPIVVIPVPLSAERRKIRGYNQAEHIARSFCDMGEHGIFELKSALVIKRKNTVPQAKIANRTKRLQNIRGAFTLTDPKFIKGRNIIIVDDVTTTGGTLTEIMDLMKKAGAKKVLGFAIAH
jgi:ComF family protein